MPNMKRKASEVLEVMDMEIDEKPMVAGSRKKRKAYIPKALKIAVWTHYIGIDKGTSVCKVCSTNVISQMDFQCGHVQSEADGGPTCLSNLVPICAKCNTSMGRKNLHEFKDTYFR